MGLWAAGCSSGPFLAPEPFLGVQDDAVPVGIAYERLRAGARAALGRSSILGVAEPKGYFLKRC